MQNRHRIIATVMVILSVAANARAATFKLDRIRISRSTPQNLISL
jgi:hypothetical protein